MLKPAKKPILQTITLCLAVLWITFPKHGGFMLGWFFLFLIPSSLKSLYFIFIKNKERKQRIIQTLLWAVTCTTIIIHHVYLYKSTQTFAGKVSQAVVAYHQENGEYPASYKILGFNKQTMREFGLHYSYKDKTPFLFYRATWIAYSTYTFDFKDNKWTYQGS